MYKVLYITIGSLLLSIFTAIITNTFDIYSLLSVFVIILTFGIIYIYLQYERYKVKKSKELKNVDYYWNVIRTELSKFIGQEELDWNKGKSNQIEPRYCTINKEQVLLYAFKCMTVSKQRMIVIINTNDDRILRILNDDSVQLFDDPYKNFKIEDNNNNAYNPYIQGNRTRVNRNINIREDRNPTNMNGEILDGVNETFNNL